MIDSSDDSIDSVIAVHDSRRLKAAPTVSSAPASQACFKTSPGISDEIPTKIYASQCEESITDCQLSKNNQTSQPIQDTHTRSSSKTQTTTRNTSEGITDKSAVQGHQIRESNKYTDPQKLTNPQNKDILDISNTDTTADQHLQEAVETDLNVKSSRKRRIRKLSKPSQAQKDSVQIKSLDVNSQSNTKGITTTQANPAQYLNVKKSATSQSETLLIESKKVTSKNSLECQNKEGTRTKSSTEHDLGTKKTSSLKATKNDDTVSENTLTENINTIDAAEMGNRLSSEKNKYGKGTDKRQKEKDSTNKKKVRKSKSPASDRESSVGNRSSIETTDSYSSAATLVATANAAVGRRSPKKSPRAIPRSGVKLRDVISSDDESFCSAGFRTPQATTPLLKRAAEPSPSQRLLDFGKTIEKGITEKFINRSPISGQSTDQNKKHSKFGNTESPQNGKGSSEFCGATIPEKLFSSLPKRCSKDITNDTDSDSFALFENKERLYVAQSKDYYPIDDNLSDDVFMSCIDLAANSPDIPSRSQTSRNNSGSQASPLSTKKCLLTNQPKSPTPTFKHMATCPEVNEQEGRPKLPSNYPHTSSDLSRSTDLPKGVATELTVSPSYQGSLPTNEMKSPTTGKGKLTMKIKSHESQSNMSGDSQSNVIQRQTKVHSPTTSRSIGTAVLIAPIKQKGSHGAIPKSPGSQKRSQDIGSRSPLALKRFPDSKSPTTQRRLQCDSTRSPKAQSTSPKRSPALPKRYEGDCSKSPTIQKHHGDERSKSNTHSKRLPKDGSKSPQIPRHAESSKSPIIHRKLLKDGSLSPAIQSPAESPTQIRKDGTIYCKINKPGIQTSVTVVAQTKTVSKNISSFPSTHSPSTCAKAEEESSQIQDSPKASKQEKILIDITKKKEHLKSTYDNVPDSDDSMIYFTGKNDPNFFEDNCVSEEIIATEQTPLHYRAEEPKKLGIEILKAPSKAKIERLSLGKDANIPSVDKIDEMHVQNPTGTTPVKALSEPQTVSNVDVVQQNKMELAPTPSDAKITATPTSLNEQSLKSDEVPAEHLTKRQIRRRNKKRNLQMGNKGSLDSGSDAPLSPLPLSPENTSQITSLEIQAKVTEKPLEIQEPTTKHVVPGNVDSIGDISCEIRTKTELDKSQIINESGINLTDNKSEKSNKPESSEKGVSHKCDHVPPPSPSAAEALTEITEEDENTGDVDNAFIDEKAREVLVFGETVLKRLSSLVESQGDTNELERRFHCDFDDDSSELSTGMTNQKKSCLVELENLCNMGDKFKEDNEYDNTNQFTEDEMKQNSHKSDPDIISISQGAIQKRPSIPCELQLTTPNNRHDCEHVDIIVDSSEPKRDSQQITEVINSYRDNISPINSTSKDNIPRIPISVLIPNKSGILFSKPDEKSEDEFYSPMRRFSGEALIVPDIEETFTELMSVKNILQDMEDKTPTAEVLPRFVGADGLASPPSYLNGSGRRSRMSPAITERTESELDISEQMDNVSVGTDSMYADDEDDGSEMIFSKTYTEEKGGECQVSYTFYNTAHEYDSDEFWADSSAAEENYKVLETSANQASCTFKKARNEMHDIQRHLQDLRRQMEYLQDDVQATSLSPSFSLGSSEWRPITE